MKLFRRLATLIFAGSMLITTAQAATYITMVTNYGTIKLELYEDKAPITVANFVKYAQEGFYDKTLFHRVIGNFMIQGGGFNTDFIQKTTNAPIKNEANNGLKNSRGTIAMARTNVVDSATSQFFINLVDNDFLNYKNQNNYGYAVFGKVVEGMDVVDKIARVKTHKFKGHSDVPEEKVVIEKVTVNFSQAKEGAK